MIPQTTLNIKVPNQHQFKGDLFFLSNMFPSPIYMSLEYISLDKREYFSKYFEFDHGTYPSSENLYQALKNKYRAGRSDFMHINPFESKKRGYAISASGIIEGWSQKRLIAMELVIDLKFNRHPNLAEKLMATPDEEICEWNTWGDIFWGKCIKTQKGTDHLGRILREKKAQLIRNNIGRS